MEEDLGKFYIMLLCRRYGEKTIYIIREKLQEFFGSHDLKDIALTLSYLIGLYDPKTGRVRRRVACIDISALGVDRDVMESGRLLEDVIEKRVDISLNISLKLLGGLEGIVSTIKEILSHLTPQDKRNLLKEIESSRRKMTNLKEMALLEKEGGIVIKMKFSDEKYARLIEAINMPTPGMIMYAMIRASLDGYENIKVSGIERNDSEIYVEFDFL